jgi:glucose/arabinose dehydrogenase
MRNVRFLFFLILLVVFLVVIGKLFNIKQLTTSPVKQILHTPTITQTINQSANNTSISSGSAPDFPMQLPANFTAHVFASGLGHPRVLVFSPGGTLLVSNPSDNQVLALPDVNHRGVADTNKTIISNENHVHGLAFYGDKLFIADVDKVVRYNWDETNLQATQDKVLFSLPQNSDHNNRTITFDNQGTMYVSVGSTCNVCNESNDWSATVIASNANGDNPHIFAKGLRNAAFIHLNPQTQELWGTEMGRDNLGDNIPPDEINIIKNGQNYGWPICYGNKIHDDNFDKRQYIRNPCEDTIAPIYEIPAHSAPLGWTFVKSQQFPADWQNDLLVAYHGSWNRSTPIGYKVVHLKVNGNSITNSEDFITGFLPSSILPGPVAAYARPVDLIFDQAGNLYLSDDKSGNIFIIQKKQ